MINYYKDERGVIVDVFGIFEVIPDEIIQTPFFSDKHGLPTSDPKKAVNNVPFEQIIYRVAETKKDFEIVFDRQFKISEMNDLGKFLRIHIEEIQKKIEGIKQFRIDVFYREIELLESYNKYLQDKGTSENRKTTVNDYSGLLQDLSTYISGVSGPDFSNIIENKAIITGTPKARWIGEKVDACYFADYLSMSLAEWRNCFYFGDNTKLHGKNRDKLQKGSPILAILNTHLPK